jgi:hypothetical protein
VNSLLKVSIRSVRYPNLEVYVEDLGVMMLSVDHVYQSIPIAKTQDQVLRMPIEVSVTSRSSEDKKVYKGKALHIHLKDTLRSDQ